MSHPAAAPPRDARRRSVRRAGAVAALTVGAALAGVCPSPTEGKARVADLTAAHPTFADVSLAHVPGVLGTILARP